MKRVCKAWRDRAEASMAARRFGLAAIPGTAGKADETVFSTLRGCLPQRSPAGFELPIDQLHLAVAVHYHDFGLQAVDDDPVHLRHTG
jgi:hypothetical protein